MQTRDYHLKQYRESWWSLSRKHSTGGMRDQPKEYLPGDKFINSVNSVCDHGGIQN